MIWINKIRNWVVVLGFLLLIVALYGRSLSYGFVWDDHVLVEGNPFVDGQRSIYDLWTSSFSGNMGWMYRPLVIFSLRLNMSMSSDPWIFHLTNVVLHGFMTLLVFLLSRRLGVSLRMSGLCAVAFAVYPPNIEPVTWISGRTDLLMGCGIFMALIAILWNPPNMIPLGGSDSHSIDGKRPTFLTVRIICLATGLLTALFSKETSTPIVFVLLLYIILSKQKPFSFKITLLATTAACLILSLFCRTYALDGLKLFSEKAGDHSFYANLVRLGTQIRLGSGFDMSALPTIPTQGGTAWINLVIGGLFLLASAAATTILFIKKKKIESLLFGLAVLMILPVAMVMLPALRYLYVPAALMIVLVSLYAKKISGLFHSKFVPVLLVLILLLWTGIGQMRIGAWQNDESLFRTEVSLNPENDNALYFFAKTLQNKKQWDKAIKIYEKILNLNVNHRPAWLGLCQAHLYAGRPVIAEKIIRETLQSEFITYPQYYWLGETLLAQGKHKEALEAFQRVLLDNPTYKPALIRIDFIKKNPS